MTAVHSTLAAALAAGLLAAPAAARSDEALGLDEIFPADTLFVLEVADLASLSESFGATAFGRLWAEPVFDGWRETWDQARAQTTEKSVEQIGIDVVALADQLQGGMGLAALKLADWIGEEEPDQEASTGLPVSFAAAARITGDPLDVLDGIDAFAATFAEETDKVLKGEEYEGVEYGVLVDPERPTGEVAYAVVDGWLLVSATDTESIGDEPMLAMIDGVLGLSDEVLADSPAYEASAAGSASGGVTFYGDVLSAIERFVAALPEAERAPLEEVFAAYGDDARMDMAATLTAGADGIDAVMEMRGSQFEEAVDMRELLLDEDARAAQWMPPEAWVSAGLQLDAAAYYDMIFDNLSETDPRAAMDMVTGMADAEELLGFHPRDDLMELLDGQFGFFMSDVPPEEQMAFAGGAPIGVALLASLTDGEAFAALLDGVVRAQGFHAARRRESFEGFDVYVIPFPPFVDIVYAVAGDVFVLSTAPSMVQDVLRRLAHDDLPSLSDGDAWRERAARLPASRSLLVHVDTTKMLHGALGMLREVQASMRSLPPEQLESQDMAWLALVELPEDTLVDEHVSGPMLLSAGVSDDGLSSFWKLVTP